MKVLVTGGATREYLDEVRFLTNMSTGRTGAAITAFFAEAGEKVLYLRSEGAVPLPGGIRAEEKVFSGFADLDLKIKKALSSGNFDAVVHLAAVSDYSPEALVCRGKTLRAPLLGKFPSFPETLTLKLRRNFKIIDQLKKYSRNKKITVVGFKLTAGGTAAEKRKKIMSVKADLTVHNDLGEISRGRYPGPYNTVRPENAHPFRAYAGGEKIFSADNAVELAGLLLDFLKRRNDESGHRHRQHSPAFRGF